MGAAAGLRAVFWSMPLLTMLVILWVATQGNPPVIDDAEAQVLAQL